MKSVKLTEAALRRVDCVVITTDHSVYDYRWLMKTAKVIVDTRNAVKRMPKTEGRLFKLGRA
jgi:UDP-N-acetyl-D-glucosamine dehydrogenase